MRRASLVALVVAGVVVSGCTEGSQGPSAGGASPSVSVGDPAPDFALPSADGSVVSLSDYHGRPVLLYFSMGPG